MDSLRFYKVCEAARLLSTSRWTINRWIADGTLPATDINPSVTGRAAYRIAETDLQTLINRLKENTCKRTRRKAEKATNAKAGNNAERCPTVTKRKLSGEKIPAVTKRYL
jgi:excisionase family DNA binding protein